MPNAGDRLGPFEVVRLLGEGGMGAVFEARDTRLGRSVALKVLRLDAAQEDRARARLVREARSASRLDHVNVATVYEVGEQDGRPFIAMALYPGETLAGRLRRGAMALPEVESVLRQVATGLAEAHRMGVIHRDLKPGNLMLTTQGVVKILDFGLAKVLSGPGDESLTAAGGVAGTVAYMAPEQARGEPVDARADVWALGVVAHEMLAGRAPFAADSVPATLSRILTEEPPPLSASRTGVPRWLASLVGRMLSKDAARRPADGAAVVAALDARGEPGRWRRPVQAAAALAAVGLLVIGLAAARKRVKVEIVPAHEASVVALPCQIFGGEDARFLTDAIPATLTTALAQVKGLKTQLPPTSVQWDPAKGDLGVIAKLFGARTCLTCAVTSMEGKLVLNIKAVDTATGNLQWTEDYEGTRTTYPDLTRRAADGVRGFLAPGTPSLAASTMDGARAEVELLLRRGDYYENQYAANGKEDDCRSARESYELALQKAPSTIDACVGLGLLTVLPAQFGRELEPRELAEAQSWAERAAKLDPSCAAMWELRAAIARFQKADYEQRIGFALKAVVAESASCRSLDGAAHTLALALPSPELQIAACEESLKERPLNWAAAMVAAYAYYDVGRIGEARKALARVATLQPESPFVLEYQTIFLLREGRIAEAKSVLGRLHEMEGSGQVSLPQYRLLDLYVALDEHDDARTAGAWAAFWKAAPCGGARVNELAHRKLYEEAIQEGWLKCDGADDGATERYWFAWNHEVNALNPELQPVVKDPRIARYVAPCAAEYRRMLGILIAARDRGEWPAYLAEPLERIIVREGP
ncbi:MAG: serine/threonine-protein kinase [Acidobacteriota bacterium]